MALFRAQLKAISLPKETVEVSELGGEVIVRAMTLSERLELFSGVTDGNRFAHIPRLLACSVIDPDGKALLSESDWEMFGGQHMTASLKLFDAVRRLSGLDVEDVAKN